MGYGVWVDGKCVKVLPTLDQARRYAEWIRFHQGLGTAIRAENGVTPGDQAAIGVMSRMCYCHGCGDEGPVSTMAAHGGDYYCAVCEAAPAEVD